MLKHLKHLHQSEYKFALDTNNITTIENESERPSAFNAIMAECTNLVAIHGRPFSMIDDTSFQNILKMIPNNTIPINAKKVRSNVETVASKVRCEISNILKNKIICLKVDIASIGPRFFLNINCQYVDGGHICLKNLGVTEIFKRHTSEHLKDLLLMNLQRYHIDTHQIYCITTDNGANMLKMTNLLNEFQEMNTTSEASQSIHHFLIIYFFSQRILRFSLWL